jgi:hypothetical protein
MSVEEKLVFFEFMHFLTQTLDPSHSHTAPIKTNQANSYQ